MPEIKEFSIAVKAAEDWIDDLQRRLGWHDRERVYHALLAALHPLRDSLTRDEAIYLGAATAAVAAWPLLRWLALRRAWNSAQPRCVSGTHS
jgi:uncharacterized protein (DUF2267 family)